jgi:hypothetical protein
VSRLAHARAMQTTVVERVTPGADLFQEIARYLAVVDALREEGIEPHWQPELSTEPERLSPVSPYS